MMKTLIIRVLTVYLLCNLPAFSAEQIRQEQIQFDKGANSARVSGKIKGYQIIDYQLRAKAGQQMQVDFQPTNWSAYFNLLAPGSKDEAFFIGSSAGNHYAGNLPVDGLYTIRVYLMRSAARRNEKANYTLDISIKNQPGNTNTGFDRTLELQGISFHVTSANQGSINTLKIVPVGLEIDNSPIEREIDGTVTNAEVADINADGSPEIYVYATSAGSGSYGSLIGYSANHRKSLSEIYLPPLVDDLKNAKGYRGHDEFAVVEDVIVQRFPVYRENDTNANPTGGTRQRQLKLVPGEASWTLKVDRVVEY
jgi:hypothetical protein